MTIVDGFRSLLLNGLNFYIINSYTEGSLKGRTNRYEATKKIVSQLKKQRKNIFCFFSRRKLSHA